MCRWDEWKKIGMGICVVLVSIGIITSFAYSKTTLTFWHHEGASYRMEAFQKVLDKFESDNPDVRVIQEAIPWGDTWPKTLSVIRTGTTPDFQFSLPDLTIFAYLAGGIIPVDEIVRKVDEKYDIIDAQLAMDRFEGHYWGVPIWTMPMLMMYRPSYLEEWMGTTEPPRYWDEWLTYAEKLMADKDGDGKIDVYGMGICAAKNLCTQEQAWTVMTTTGTRLFDEEGNVVFDSPEAVKAVDMYKKLFKYVPEGAENWSWGEINMNFPAGRMAMAPYFAQQRFFYEANNLDLAAVRVPIPREGGKKNTLTYLNDIHIYKQAEAKGHLPAIEKLILFMHEPDNIATLCNMEQGYFIPVTKVGLKSEAFWNDPVIRALKHISEALVDEIPSGTLYGFTTGRASNLAIGAIAGANIIAEVIQRAIILGETPEAAVKWGAEVMRKMAAKK